MSGGRLEILSEKHVMLPNSVLISLSKINPKLMYPAVKKQAQAAASRMAKKLGVKDAMEFQKSFPDVFMMYGLGRPEIVDLDTKLRRALVRVRGSPIAAELRGSSEAPVCFLTAAVLAGIFSYILKKDVNAKEKNCEVKGEDFCQFVLK